MKAIVLSSVASLGLGLALSACDSTPRERQEIVRQEMTKLDTAARNTGRTLSRLGRQTVRFDSANHARRAEPLAPAKQLRMDHELLGSYAEQIGSLTPATIAGAYGELLRATRVRQTSWQARDWDYAQDTYRRLNAQLARIRLDLPAHDELRIRAWQAEFTALRAKRTAKDLHAATATKR
ncbi:hypothetical protein GCM10023172_22270 [Hymenobacter ginsengisoli]|uniref:DUF4142 domain-containing protein n=1 Tax=Hymenobacter ginsengisoli TaxID=1051626 RepID=A0ABP8QCI5_9BACT|nr:MULTISPECIES: hypothetical protein [unclassified Hymenobacter]MBO2032008.1 hypothetical protein [Hymenobacter sp. BT559]